MNRPKFLKKDRIYIVPTRTGILYACLVLFFLFLAADQGSQDFLVVIAFLISLGLVAMYLTHLNIYNLEITQVQVEPGFAGETALLTFQAKNGSSTPLISIQFNENLKDFQPGTSQRVSCQVPLGNRGESVLRKIKFSTIYPLGFFYAWRDWEGEVYSWVYPSRREHSHSLETLRISTELTSGILESRDELPNELSNPLPNNSEGDEYLWHREMRPNDSAHRVDWKLYARRKELRIKTFQAPSQPKLIPTAQFRLWLSRAPGATLEEKLAYLSSAIVFLNEKEIPFGLVLENQEIPIKKGVSHFHHCLQALAAYPEKNQELENNKNV